MEEATVEKKLAELIATMQGVSPASESCYAAVKHHRGVFRAKTVPMTDAVDSLDWLRVRVKYLLFDLEATRRENAYLKRLLQCEDRE